MEKHPGNIHMVQNAMVPLWRVQKQLRPILGGRHYYANSSIMAFVPRERSFIFDAFNAAIATGMDPCPRHLLTDDRFISLMCKDQLRVIPNWLAVKFTEEYMLPFPILEDMRRQLPGIAARRRGLVAITFNGFMPAKLRQFKEGDLVKRRGVKVRWPDAALSEYWR
jgi:hypothetical protein